MATEFASLTTDARTFFVGTGPSALIFLVWMELVLRGFNVIVEPSDFLVQS